MELIQYNGERKLEESASVVISFDVLYDTGEVETIRLDDSNCEKFEEHLQFVKIYYKNNTKGREQFIPKSQMSGFRLIDV